MAEAIAQLETVDYTAVLEAAQLIFADRYGNSAIFEGDEIIVPDGDSQIALNFYWSQPELGYYPDWRLDILEDMLGEDLELTLDYFTEMADAVHQGTEPGSSVHTRYTTIGDPARGRL